MADYHLNKKWLVFTVLTIFIISGYFNFDNETKITLVAGTIFTGIIASLIVISIWNGILCLVNRHYLKAGLYLFILVILLGISFSILENLSMGVACEAMPNPGVVINTITGECELSMVGCAVSRAWYIEHINSFDDCSYSDEEALEAARYSYSDLCKYYCETGQSKTESGDYKSKTAFCRQFNYGRFNCEDIMQCDTISCS